MFKLPELASSTPSPSLPHTTLQSLVAPFQSPGKPVCPTLFYLQRKLHFPSQKSCKLQQPLMQNESSRTFNALSKTDVEPAQEKGEKV
jgi:hypothetical protein